MVERASQVVNCVSDDSARSSGDGLAHAKHEALWAALRIVFRRDHPRLLVEPSIKKSINLLYMMPRPVHLSHDARQMGVERIEAG